MDTQPASYILQWGVKRVFINAVRDYTAAGEHEKIAHFRNEV